MLRTIILPDKGVYGVAQGDLVLEFMETLQSLKICGREFFRCSAPVGGSALRLLFLLDLCRSCVVDVCTKSPRRNQLGFTCASRRNCNFEHRKKESLNKTESEKKIYDDEYIISHITKQSIRLREKYIIDNFPYFHEKILRYIKNNHIAINQNK